MSSPPSVLFAHPPSITDGNAANRTAKWAARDAFERVAAPFRADPLVHEARVRVSVCLFLCVSVCVSLFLRLCVYVSLCLCIYVTVHVHVCLQLSISSYQPFVV